MSYVSNQINLIFVFGKDIKSHGLISSMTFNYVYNFTVSGNLLYYRCLCVGQALFDFLKKM